MYNRFGKAKIQRRETGLLRGVRKGERMEDILRELEQEEIAEHKKELRQYLDEIPDQVFYQYFDIMPMSNEDYDFICRDLARRHYYCLLARFSERHNGVRRRREESAGERNSGKI